MPADRPSRLEVEATAALYNVAFFGGVLRPVIHWRRMAAYGACYEPSGKYPYGLIVLSTTLPEDVLWSEVLLHELIHCFLDVMFPNIDEYEHGPVSYHGPVFTEECNRLGSVLGLPPVTEEDAWHWPMCVRYDYHPEPASDS